MLSREEWAGAWGDSQVSGLGCRSTEGPKGRESGREGRRVVISHLGEVKQQEAVDTAGARAGKITTEMAGGARQSGPRAQASDPAGPQA